MSLLRRIEKSLDQRLRSIFSGGEEEPGAREAVELYATHSIGSRAGPRPANAETGYSRLT